MGFGMRTQFAQRTGFSIDAIANAARAIFPYFCVLLACVIASTSASQAQIQFPQKKTSIPLIRDAEIEALLQDYTSPLFRAAGLNRSAVDVYLVNDHRFNAFVTGRRMFINVGAIKISETPGEIIGVMAHETGHVIGGHQARLRDRMDKAGALSILALLAGAGAIALGGDAGNAAGQALAFGGQSAILRDLLAYRRSEETAADNSAIELLDKTGQSAAGMLRTFERFNQNMLFQGSQVDPYLRSHPMPRERIALLEEIARKSPHFDRKDPPALQLRHDMARAKIAAYGDRPGEMQSMFRDDPRGPSARYGLAIAMFLRGSTSEAVPIIDRLIAEQPSNPYLHEIKGEMLLLARQVNQSVDALKKAVALDKRKSGLIRVKYGHALLETRNPGLVSAAIREIKAGLARDPTSPRGYGLLARAYNQLGEPDRARAAAAEEAFYSFKFKDAKRLAQLAQPKLKRGSPEWLRMQDIIDYKPPKK